jgi:hypothetical protein
MVMRKVRTGLLVAALALCSAAAGMAATAGQPEDARAQPAAADSLPDKDEALEAARSAVGEMEAALNDSQRKEASAIGVKDFMQVNCVAEKIKAMKGLLQIADLARLSLEEALKQGDAKLVKHNQTKISLARARIRTFRGEVDNCVGEMSMYTGESVTEATIDSDIREDDPTEGEILAGDPLESERPYDMTPSMPQ